MPVGDIFRVSIMQRLHGQRLINTLHYRLKVDDPAGFGPLGGVLADRIRSQILPEMKACQSAELTHEGIIVQKIWPLPPQVPKLNTVDNGPGTPVSSSLPTSVAVVITKMTDFAGRKYRGRIYVGGVPVSHENDSVLDAAVLPTWGALATKLFANMTTGLYVFEPVLWHKESHTFDVVSFASARAVLRNQRRRQVGKGE